MEGPEEVVAGFRSRGGLVDRRGVTSASDDRLLDRVRDLSKLSDRQLLERLVRTTERIETQMANDTSYIEAALSSLDVQLTDLGTRTQNWAELLKQAVSDSADLAELKSKVSGYADRIQADAVTVLGMAQPSAIADPAQPDATATPVPSDPATPIAS